FQDLCLTIAGGVLGQAVQSFTPVRDGGRDGAFQGTWQSTDSLSLEGSFTLQCKFSSRDTPLTLSEMREELSKLRKLGAAGLATNYIVITNRRLSAVSESEIRKAVESIPGVTMALTLGREWVIRQIRESPRLRMLVPRLYGLGDLSQILDE